MLGRNSIPFVVGEGEQQHTRHRLARDFRDGLDSFAIVRDPYTRMVSWYKWCCRLPKYSAIPFDEFVLAKYNKGRAKRAWMTQTEWTHDLMHQTQLVTHILKYERLQHDLCNLFPQIQGKWLHLNGSGIENYDAYYSSLTRDAVTAAFYEDFINFGYDTK